MTGSPPPSLKGDILYGAQAIADFLDCTRGKVYRLARNRRIPVFTQGGSELCARRSTLTAWIENQEQKSFDFGSMKTLKNKDEC